MHLKTLTYRVFFLGILFSLLFVPSQKHISAAAQPLYAPVPGVSIDIPSSLLIGEDFSFTVTFDNTSAADVGYGPYIDVFLPQSGADDSVDAEKEDGITYTSVDYLGYNVRSWDGICTDNGTFTHPLTGLTVTCPAAPAGMVTPFTWQYLVVELPFGSFAPEQPVVPVTITAQMSDFADLGLDLPVFAQGGFRFGADALHNPATDPPIVGTRISAATTPALFILNKQYLWREDETPTGPNYPRQYLLTVDIPEGQTVTDLVITDILPGNMQYISVDSTSPAALGCSVPSTTVPGGSIACTFASVTGTAAGVDASVTFSFYIPLDDVADARVIPPETGGCVLSENIVSATADWDPLDPRDPLASPAETLDPGHELEDCSHTIQKFHEIQDDVSPASYSPGDTIEYRHEFQVSDFFAEDDFTVTDTISDGQHFDNTFTPTLSIDGNTYALSVADFNPANFTVAPDYTPADPAPNTGQTVITFRVSDEIITRGQPNGRLIGGCVPTAGTAGANPDCVLYNDGPTTGVITYRTTILEEFTDDFPSGDESVDQGDRLINSVLATAQILNNADLSPTGNTASEDSGQSFTIPYGLFQKSIYAVNGSTSFSTPVYLSPLETITYRITYSLNTSDIEDMEIDDFLPLPVLDADELTTFDNIISSDVPAAGHIKFGPDDTFRDYSGIVPTMAIDSINNSLQLYYGDFDSPLNESKVIDILFTVTVSDDPFADELYLTNKAQVYEGSTNHLESSATALVQFILHEPDLTITKGAVASDRIDAFFTPDPPAPVAFSAPGSGCPRAGGLINSAALDTNPIDSDISNLDAADLVTFAVVVENMGHSGAYDVRLRDDLPAGFQVPSGGINLCVTDGAGSPLVYTDLGGGFLGSGIELNNAVGGALQPGLNESDELLATGENIAVVTFDLELIDTVEPADMITNTATLFNYSGAAGGGDFTAEDQTDDADTTVRSPVGVKAFVDSNYAHTASNELTIGETAEFTLTVTFPEGEIPAASLTDSLPVGLAFVDCLSITPSSGDLTTDLAGGFAAACSDPTNPAIAAGGGSAVFALGNVTNSNTDNSVAETLTIRFSAVALNIIENQDGDTLTNNASFTWTGGTTPLSPAAVLIVEPPVDVDKTVTPTVGDAGDLVTYTITVTNPLSGINAFNVTLDDIVPAEITYQAGSFTNTAGLAPDSIAEAPNLNAYWDVFPAGSSSTFQFQGEIKTSVTPGDVIFNDAIVKFTSLPGAPGQQSPYNTLSYERTGDQTDPGTTANDYTVTDPATTTITIPTPIKYLIATSESHTTGTSVAIGEIVRYRISTIIPEGTSEDFTIRDLLPTGLLYLDDGTAQFAFVSNGSGITSSTLTCANDTGSSGAPADIATALIDCPLPASALTNAGTANPFTQGNDPWFSLGNLVNADDDEDREYAIVEFNALVVNISSNQAGTTRTNDFRVYEGGAQVADAQNLSVTVVEPNISIDKSVTAGPYDAGDTLTYTITITNNATANATAAFDLDIVDTIDPALQVQSHTVTVPGYATENDTSSGNNIQVAVDRLNPGDSVTITIEALIPADAPAYLDIPNTAALTYTSLPLENGTLSNPTGSDNTGLPGAETGERTGDDGVGGALNDYAAQDPADITLTAPSIDKQDASPIAYTIGEEITFPIIITLPEGETRDLQVIDNLPVGLDYINYTLTTSAAASGGLLSADYSGSALAPTLTAPGGSGADATLSFGDVLTTADGDPDNNSFLITITMRVMNIPVNDGGDTLDNTASLTFTNPNTGGTTTITDAPVSIDLIEPVMQITKTFDPDQAAINETVQVELVVTNIGTSPAYDVIIEDPYPTTVFQSVAEVTTPGDFTFSSTTAAGFHTVTYSGGPIEVGGSRTFTINATVGGVFAAGDTYLNTATVTQATTIDGPDPFERDEPDVSADDTLTGIAPDLVLTKDDGRTVVLPGDILVYTITIENVGLHDAQGLTVTDEVPVDTTFNAAGSDAGWSCADGDPAGTVCTLSIPALASGAQTQVFFAVQVNDPVLSATDQIQNTASVADDGVFGVDPTPGNNSDDDIDTLNGAPIIEVYKTDTFLVDADASGNPSAGDTLRYTITIENTGDQDAGDVVLSDTPDANTTLVAGSVTTSQGTVTTGNTIGDTDVVVSLGEIPGAGGVAQVTFDVTINDPLPAGTTYVENQAIISGSNFSDEPSDDPDYPDEDEPTITLLDGALIKVIAATNQVHTTGNDVAIGELVEYELTLFVPPGQTRLAQVTDTLTRGLAFVDCIAITPGAGLTTDLAGGFAAACAAPTVNESPFGSLDDIDQGRQVIYDLGSLTNSTGAAVPLVISYRTVVLNAENNQDGSQVHNAVIWDYEGGSLSAAAPALDIVEPDMNIVKSANRTSAQNGDIITFTLRILHDLTSIADAFELEMTDALPANLVYVPGSFAYVSGTLAAVDDTDPTVLTATWVDFPLGGTETVLQFQVQVTGLSAGQSTNNTALLAWSSLPGDVSAPQSVHNILSTERDYDPPSLVNIYGDADGVTIRRPAPEPEPTPAPTPTLPSSK